MRMPCRSFRQTFAELPASLSSALFTGGCSRTGWGYGVGSIPTLKCFGRSGFTLGGLTVRHLIKQQGGLDHCASLVLNRPQFATSDVKRNIVLAERWENGVAEGRKSAASYAGSVSNSRKSVRYERLSSCCPNCKESCKCRPLQLVSFQSMVRYRSSLLDSFHVCTLAHLRPAFVNACMAVLLGE